MPTEKLKQLFMQFPGVGPKQAERFVYFLLGTSMSWRKDFIEQIEALSQQVAQCQRCFRYYQKPQHDTGTCRICSDQTRHKHLLLLVAHPADVAHIERSQTYQGQYFVLGGLLALNQKKHTSVRISALIQRLKQESDIKEIIFALPATVEGDYTTHTISKQLAEQFPHLRQTMLGRGLSTGIEIEYTDPDTLASAMHHRLPLQQND